MNSSRQIILPYIIITLLVFFPAGQRLSLYTVFTFILGITCLFCQTNFFYKNISFKRYEIYLVLSFVLFILIQIISLLLNTFYENDFLLISQPLLFIVWYMNSIVFFRINPQINVSKFIHSYCSFLIPAIGVVAIYGIFNTEFLLLFQSKTELLGIHATRATAPFHSPYILSTLLSYFAFVSLYWFIVSNHIQSRLFWLFCMSISVISFISCQSRTGIFALSVSFLSYVFIHGFEEKISNIST